jgi:hypothetical protein
MGKQELEDGLVTGLFFRTVDIAVNRESKMSSFRAFKKAMPSGCKITGNCYGDIPRSDNT